MNSTVAKASFKGSVAEVTNMIFYSRRLKFRCRRCASLCCKLGGPPLSQKDINRIERAGYNFDVFSESTFIQKFKLPETFQSVMKNREDGSCIFLKTDDGRGTYECSIYDWRPVLCRLYPFYVEIIGSNSFLLRVIPCCRGLNSSEGETVNEEFFSRHLQEAIIDLLPAST